MPSTVYTYQISEKVKKAALKSAEALESLHLNSSSKKNIEVTIDETDIVLPKIAFPILQEILTRIAKGQSFNPVNPHYLGINFNNYETKSTLYERTNYFDRLANYS